ncbi:beta-lactamase domain protein [Deinococcus proteolyticus MRP]|uniref:Beta-lactamase domain protein n=1 Tax=Deinococcus proteolyticus (strain ATCC 35074 / DSM 20540 / JCM 6276 / NBRC 101906 / NCIMB 13154 / VKM Ac-1939 / CCM 2703 / MRP) TaxID=693977 RepID=F0RLR5_DEIPM|nr:MULTISPECIES: MBL fold metallo-hydrolase [Deinococcus]ADY25904.1 beta-lactamase domain protein [Deinococcus proteolyticus MRP]MCY1702026.1 MBL fold metallo-hydrolase [Deinococcus sp. SL84]
MTLQRISDRVWWLGGAVSSVAVDNGAGGALIVDTGLDDAQARKLLRGLEAQGLAPAAILNTHSHADHHGGNAHILKKHPDLPVYAPPLEAAIIRHPLLEPLSLYGAMPPAELQNKFLLAPASPAQELDAGPHTLGGAAVELLAVPGHAVQMFAVRVDDVLYAADALFGPEALSKHPLTFCADSAAQKASAQALGELRGVRTVLVGHGEPSGDLTALAGANLQSYAQTTAWVLDAVGEGAAGTDDILARVAARAGVSMGQMGPLLLNRAVVAAHLKELLTDGVVQAQTVENRLCWGVF